MLGIDASKKTLQCALRDPLSERVLWDQDFTNTSAGISLLLKRTPVAVPWVIEPTGRYSLVAVRQAQAAGRKVLMAPPRKAKLFLQSLQSRAKTDKLDARGLALFALSRPLAPYPVKEEALDIVDQLLSARKDSQIQSVGSNSRPTSCPTPERCLAKRSLCSKLNSRFWISRSPAR